METNISTTAGTGNAGTPEPHVTLRSERSIRAVFKLILVDAIRDFFTGIVDFFKRYGYHYSDSARYLWNPSPLRVRADSERWKDHCRHTFELSLLALFLIIFMVKLEWIPQSAQEIMEMLSNDLHQMGLEVVLFFLFALCYLVFVSLSILAGRLLRIMFDFSMTRFQCDLLFAYLNNVIFSITVIPSLLLRFSASALSGGENGEMLVGMWVVLFFLYLPLILTWSARFALKNGFSRRKRFAFIGITFFPFTLFYSYVGVFLTSLLFNV